MQIVSCTKRNSGDGIDRKRGETQPFEDRQTEEWDIVVDTAGASSTWILQNAPLPNAYSPHPDNANLRCTGEHQIRREGGSPIHFVAVVTYETPPPGSALPEPQEVPSDKRPEKREREPYLEEWSTYKSQEQIDVDINGKPIATVVGEQFDPPVVEDVWDIQAVFGKNVDQKNQNLINARGHTNTDQFQGYAAGQCLIDSVNYKYFTDPDNNKSYWRQTVTVLIREPAKGNPQNILIADLWKKRIRAEGYKVFQNANDNEPVKAKDSDGEYATTPVLHNPASGQQIDDPTQAQWYFFRTKGETAFQPLKID